MPGISDWAAEYLFGDVGTAVSSGEAWMGGANLTPRTPEERQLSRLKRGAPEVAREAKILEADDTAPPPRRRLARQPAPTPPEAAADESPAPPAHESPAAPAAEAPAPPAAESPAPPAHESPAPPAHESPAPPAHESPAPPAHESPAPPAAESPAAPTRATVSRVARDVARAAAPVRPAVRRVARPAPPVRPAEAASQPAKPSLLRRIADRLRGETAPAEPPAQAGAVTSHRAEMRRGQIASLARQPAAPPLAATAPNETAPLAAGQPEDLGVEFVETETSPVGVARVERAPLEIPTLQEAPGETVSEEGPGGETPRVDSVSAEIPPTERAPKAITPAGTAPVEIARVERAPVGKAPVGKAPVEIARVERAPGERAPVERAPVERAPAEMARAEMAAVGSRVVSPPAQARPRVGLQRAAREASDTSQRLAGTDPVRLARALGTDVQVDEAGNQTVEMPPAPFSTAPRTVTRALAEESVPAAEAASTTAATPPAAAPTPQAVDIDQITETVIDNIRRELLVEREQAGGPMDLL